MAQAFAQPGATHVVTLPAQIDTRVGEQIKRDQAGRGRRGSTQPRQQRREVQAPAAPDDKLAVEHTACRKLLFGCRDDLRERCGEAALLA